MKYVLSLIYIPLGIFGSGIFGLLTTIYLYFSKPKPKSIFKFVLIIYYAGLFISYSFLFDAEINYISLIILLIIPVLSQSPKIITNNKNIAIIMFFILILLFVFFYDTVQMQWFGFFYDRNVFSLIVLPFLLYVSKKYKYGFILAIALSVFIGSRNLLLAILLEKVLSKLTIFKLIYRYYPITIAFIFTLLSVVLLFVLAYYQNSFIFIDDRSYLSILDTSNLQRAIAMFNAVDFLYQNPIYLFFGNGWEEYSQIVTTRVHNDFIQFIIKYGILVFLPFYYYLLKAYNKSNIDGSIIISLIVFSSILGGFMWGMGLYWLFISIYLFGHKKIKIINRVRNE